MNIKITNKYNFSSNDVIIGNEEKALPIETINFIRHILQLNSIKSVDEYFENISQSLNRQTVNWCKFLPNNKKNDYNGYLKNSLIDSEKYITNYFYDEFPKRLSLFKMINHLDEDNPSVYKHSNITGRLSIEKGINYLTMKKDERNKLSSPFTNHRIYEMDFRSCEPNLYMRHFNLVDDSVEDIYVYISKIVEVENEERDVLKRIILSILYGANERSVASYSKINIKKIKKIKKILNVDAFELALRKEYNEKGHIKNLYGRPILSDSNLVNYWIQSSAVDYCCLCFYELFKNNKSFKLHAVIHDAVIFSVHEADLNQLKSIHSLNYKNLEIPVQIKDIQADN